MDGSVEIDTKGTYLDIEIGSPHRLFSTVYRCPKYQLFFKKNLDFSKILYIFAKVIQINMVGKYKVVTLCGSTKFKEQFLKVQKKLTLDGCIVISVGLFGHSGDEEVWKPGTKEMLDDMHLRKIDMADEVFVINVGGYIGDSTKREITYAESKGKKINYLE